MRSGPALVPALLFALACACGPTSPKVQEPSNEEVLVEKPAASEESAQPAPTEAQATKSTTRREVLGYLPSDRSIVIHLDWSKLRNSELYLQHRDTVLRELAEGLDKVKNTCGFDPLEALQSITIAMGPDPSDDKDMLMAVSGHIGRSEVEQCITRLGGKVEEGRYEFDGDSMGVRWATTNTAIVAAKLSAEDIKKRIYAGSALDNEVLMAVLRRTDSHATLWGGGLFPATMQASMGSVAQGLHAFSLSGNAWSGVDLSLGLDFRSEEQANAMRSMVDMGIQAAGGQLGLGEMARSVDVSVVGSTLNLDAALSQQQITQILDKAM